jgi:chemotaxis signal transduction protein
VIEPTDRRTEGEPNPPGAVAALLGTAVLVAELGGRRVAVLSAVVERVLPMAELTPLSDPPPGVVGVLSVHGAPLPVVDPRPRLGLATPRVRPEQHLILIAAAERYLLWVDRVDSLVSAAIEELPVVGDGHRRHIARLHGEAVLVLAADPLLPMGAAPAGPEAE